MDYNSEKTYKTNCNYCREECILFPGKRNDYEDFFTFRCKVCDNIGVRYHSVENYKEVEIHEKVLETPEYDIYFVSGPNNHTFCEKKYIELLIRVMCLETGDDPEDYTATKFKGRMA